MFQLTRFLHNAVFFRNQNAHYVGARCTTLATLSFEIFDLIWIPSWLVWAEIKSTVHVALPKRPKKQLKAIWQSSRQALIAYCSNIYILWMQVCMGVLLVIVQLIVSQLVEAILGHQLFVEPMLVNIVSWLFFKIPLIVFSFFF